MAIFARVADEGSFRGAAKSLGLAPSRISETVSDLETHLGITLLYRTTRKVALTTEGRMFYARVTDMLRAAETGVNEINALSQDPSGSIRVSVPAFMTSSSISTALAEFVRLYPRIKLSVSYTDLPIGLIDDGFDLNIRVGWLNDSSMMSRKLSEYKRVLVTGAEYAASRTKPTHPKDIENWDWIRYKQRADYIEFTSKNGNTVKVTEQYQLQVDNIDALLNFTLQNLGVTVLPCDIAESGLQSGKLVQLLPDWDLRTLGCYAVWPDTSLRESMTLLLVRFLAENERCSEKRL